MTACQNDVTAPSAKSDDVSLATIKPAASVTLDLASGTGFVGKGDVQTVLGLDNAGMQAIANSLSFTYETTETYDILTAWATGNIDNPVSLNAHTATVTTIQNVFSDIAYDPRKVNGQKQYTGFNLKGFGGTSVFGELPALSPTVTYVTFSWRDSTFDHWAPDTTIRTTLVTKVDTVFGTVKVQGRYPVLSIGTPYTATVSDTTIVKNGHKVYVYADHTSESVPAYVDEAGNLVLYTEGNNKAVLAINLVDRVSVLKVNGALLPITN